MELPLTDVRSPVVTVAIPTYGGDRHLGAAIESVLRQTFTDFELVVIDDSSPDKTAAIVARFADPRLVYLRNARNLGPQGNWNRCLEVARGRYFKLLPHDDVLHPSCLERQVGVLDADADQRIALTFSARDVLGPDGRTITRRSYPGGREGVITGSKVMRDCVRRGTNLVGEPGAVMFRRSLADRVGQFDATNPYVIDLDYWFRLLGIGDAHYCPERLAGFRISGASWSVAIGARQGRDFREFAERVDSSATFWDHSVGRFAAYFNNLARLAFYRIYLR